VEIKYNTSLKTYNTFGVEAYAKRFVEIQHENDLVNIFDQGIFQDSFFVLGGGSNVLFTKDFDGTIIKVNNKGIQHFIEGNNIFVTSAGGEVWNDLVWYCIDHNFPGLENMALIPGTVGASPVQNIGAYGTELMDVFYSCRAFDTYTGGIKTFTNKSCEFTYRDSIFKSKYKGRYIILSVTYKLKLHTTVNTHYGAIEAELLKNKISNPTIKEVAEIVSKIRVEKLPDPNTVGNAGSFFKNPIITKEKLDSLLKDYPQIANYPFNDTHVKVAAGWLIEMCGWKGKQVDNVTIWKNQALVITNSGNASGAEVYNISTKIIQDVEEKFNIILEREVNIL